MILSVLVWAGRETLKLTLAYCPPRATVSFKTYYPNICQRSSSSECLRRINSQCRIVFPGCKCPSSESYFYWKKLQAWEAAWISHHLPCASPECRHASWQAPSCEADPGAPVLQVPERMTKLPGWADRRCHGRLRQSQPRRGRAQTHLPSEASPTCCSPETKVTQPPLKQNCGENIPGAASKPKQNSQKHNHKSLATVTEDALKVPTGLACPPAVLLYKTALFVNRLLLTALFIISTDRLTCETGVLCKYVLLEYTDFYVNAKNKRTMALLMEKTRILLSH